MKERAVVAMSGGVDSSVAAALLKKQGYEVIGITMCFNLDDSSRKRPACCSIQGIEDARRVAHQLEIRHYVLNMQKALKERVIDNFCEEYAKGRTPNPCVWCNKYIKFGALLKRALSLGASFLATGHYARVVNKGRAILLKKARDLRKDQTYFLYRLNQSQLKRVLFPLGDLLKDEVRQLAREFKLSVADKLASQEICFLPDEDYRSFLKSRLLQQIRPGPIVDKQGNILGQHKGLASYTIGQREGLGIAKGYPVYIIQLDAKNNRIVIGTKEDACSSKFLLKNGFFSRKSAKKRVALKVKIRYNHQESCAKIEPAAGRLIVEFDKPQFAVTPGQSAVFYDADEVAGGGIIDKVLG